MVQVGQAVVLQALGHFHVLAALEQAVDTESVDPKFQVQVGKALLSKAQGAFDRVVAEVLLIAADGHSARRAADGLAPGLVQQNLVAVGRVEFVGFTPTGEIACRWVSNAVRILSVAGQQSLPQPVDVAKPQIAPKRRDDGDADATAEAVR